jgi:hypothetical protein
MYRLTKEILRYMLQRGNVHEWRWLIISDLISLNECYLF